MTYIYIVGFLLFFVGGIKNTKIGTTELIMALLLSSVWPILASFMVVKSVFKDSFKY